MSSQAFSTQGLDDELAEYVSQLVEESRGCLDEESIEKLIECSFTGEGRAILSFGGIRLTVPCSHLPEAWANLLHIYCTRDYEKLDSHTPRRGWVVVDAGAYLGFYTLRAASLLDGDGLVVAVEPLAENRLFIEENVVLNGFESVVRIDPRALSDREGIATFYVSCYPATSSLFSAHIRYYGDVCGEKRVATTTLTSLLEDHGLDKVDLLKLDVEGAEGIVLGVRGWEEIIERIVVEVHTDMVSVEHVKKLLEERGFITRAFQVSEAQVIVYAW